MQLALPQGDKCSHQHPGSGLLPLTLLQCITVKQTCYRCTDRSGADTRVKLLKPLQTSPKGFTGLKAHELATLDGMGFVLECTDDS